AAASASAGPTDGAPPRRGALLPGGDGRPVRGPLPRGHASECRRMIGYYVHHQGRGHVNRALRLARHIDGEVTGLSSLERPAGWQGPWIQLARDDQSDPPLDPTARGQLHWAPLGDRGLSSRMARIAEW